jgi:hypothetical protein
MTPKERYEEIMALALHHLGDACAKCGSDQDLEIDHIDPKTKSFNISSMTCFSWERIEIELRKCQALCRPCHIEKSIAEQSIEHGEGLTGKKNCRCELCGPLKRTYMREYQRRRRAAKRMASGSAGC